MNIKYDKVADAVYIKMTDGVVASTTKIDDAHYLDKDGQGNIIGLEILDASSQEDLVSNLEKNVSEGVSIDIVSSTPALA